MNLFIFLLGALLHGPITVKSPSFSDDGFIPAKYSCKGDNVNPALMLSGIPKNAKSLALIVVDPDAPNGEFVHWVMWNIQPVDRINENTAPGEQGLNGRKENKYTGPCPPKGTHHYHFKVYALNAMLKLPAGTDKAALEAAMKDHIIATGEITGLFGKD